MLPSMPILFTRDSLDAFGNKIVPSTSYLNENIQTNTKVQSEASLSTTKNNSQDEKQNEANIKTNIDKKEEQTNPKSDENFKETALVRSYYTKIQSRFASHLSAPTNKFVQFREILRTFDPSKETPVDLYKKVEQLFGAKHSDIVEEFLLFLKPCQAASVGRFMDHFMLSQMTVFIELLQASLSTTKNNSQDEKQNEANIKTNIDKKEEQTNPKSDENFKETALVRSYYTKIQSRFASHLSAPTNKFVQFREILRTFDPSKETPVDLYKKVEQLFGAKHSDIVEEFLLFLKPCQAASVGRFMDHFMLSQMTVFIELLQSTLSRKPTVLRKIIRAITTGINSGNSADMKARVLPHLRSNPRLIQMFKTLFPDERPPDSVYDIGSDMLEDSFLECDKGYDVWEFEDKDNTKKADAKVLDSEYLHGRVFLQHGRLLRTACVTYPYSKEPYRSHARRLAPNHCLSPPESDSERASPKRNNKSTCKIPQKRTRKQLKSPTKSAKDVNDNTKKECITIPLNNAKVKSRCQKSKQNKKEEVTNKKKESINKSACVKKDYELKVKQNKVGINELKLKQLKEVKVENRSWTRDEDKTMLEVLKGEPGSEQVFIRIRELLPHRTTTEIKERFCHVMNLLQQMAVNEVT